MIPRYSREKMSKIWTTENKFNIWLKLESLVADKLSINGKIPTKAAKAIKKKGKFNLKEIEKIEKKTKHDMVAFINNVSSYIGEYGKFFHYGITSSDIIDTGFSLQLKESLELIIEEVKDLNKNLKKLAIKHKNTIMIGRTHGMHAEPITFGLKIASFYSEFKRNLERLYFARDEISICSISGPVGTYNSIDPSIELYVAKKMGLKPEKISTQIIPRDRHAFFFSMLGILASSLERLATEIRHLQRSELIEVEENFDKTQKGSSAMPHKRNPVLSENVTGLCRYIRSAAIPSMENISVWHERDISHSSIERILAPDITVATDFAISRMSNVIKNLKVYPRNMKKNLNKFKGLHLSQNLLLALIEKGATRQKAYEIIQSVSMNSLKKEVSFKDLLNINIEFKKYINSNDLKKIFSKDYQFKYIEKIFKKVFNEAQ